MSAPGELAALEDFVNSDDERGVYLPIDLENPPTAEQAAGMVERLSAGWP